MTKEDAYSTGVLSHQSPTELDRLRRLEASLDPFTIQCMELLGVQENWRCLEIGAGAGSIAKWLSRRCTAGHVTATDLDTTLLTPAANLTVLQHDVCSDTFPDGAFDLIHARIVLSHIPARDTIFARMRPWLAPGGAILIEDIDVQLSDASPFQMIREAIQVTETFLARRQATNARWARRLPLLLSEMGCSKIEMRAFPLLAGSQHSTNGLWAATFSQLHSAAKTEEPIAADVLSKALALLADPEFTDLPGMLISAWGRG